MAKGDTYSEREVAIVRKFCNGYFWIRILRRYFREIFEKQSSSPIPIMKRAVHFFHDLSNLMVDHFLLQAAKVMDHARTLGHDNLSAYYLLEQITSPDEVRQKLLDLVAEMERFNQHMRDARNRILSHNDLETILSGEVLGAFPEGMDTKFLSSLGEFVELVHRTCVGTPYNPVETFPGDAMDFMKIIREANALERYMADHPESRTEIIAKYLLRQPDANETAEA
jgi:hypothetical protein